MLGLIDMVVSMPTYMIRGYRTEQQLRSGDPWRRASGCLRESLSSVENQTPTVNLRTSPQTSTIVTRRRLQQIITERDVVAHQWSVHPLQNNHPLCIFKKRTKNRPAFIGP